MQSDTSGLTIPELDLELAPGTLGGKYTTLEGILEDIRANLETANPFALGDSSDSETRIRFAEFMGKLTDLPKVEKPFTFILDDPLGNSYIYAELGPKDPNMNIEKYERTFEQNEELGLNDINVDNYLDDEEDKKILQQEIEKDKLENNAREEAERNNNSNNTATREEIADKDKIEHAKVFGKVGGKITKDLEELNTVNNDTDSKHK